MPNKACPKAKSFLVFGLFFHWFLNYTRGRAFRREISKIHRVAVPSSINGTRCPGLHSQSFQPHSPLWEPQLQILLVDLQKQPIWQTSDSTGMESTKCSLWPSEGIQLEIRGLRRWLRMSEVPCRSQPMVNIQSQGVSSRSPIPILLHGVTKCSFCPYNLHNFWLQ